MHELFMLLCFEYRCVTIPYFFDEMEEFEVQSIIENLEYYERGDWERTRFLAYCNLQKSSTKKINPQIIVFPWEKEHDNTDQINGNSEPLSKEDIQRLKEQARLLSTELRNQ